MLCACVSSVRAGRGWGECENASEHRTKNANASAHRTDGLHRIRFFTPCTFVFVRVKYAVLWPTFEFSEFFGATSRKEVRIA